MSTRAYIFPLIGTGEPRVDPRRPKYLSALGINSWSIQPYGGEALCAAICEVTDAAHAQLAANLDVYAFPSDPDASLGGAERTRLLAFLAAAGLPDLGLTPQDSPRSVLRGLHGLFRVAQKLQAQSGRRMLPAGVTLATPWNALDPDFQAALTTAAAALGLSTTVLSGATPLRTILAALAAQVDGPVHLGGLTL